MRSSASINYDKVILNRKRLSQPLRNPAFWLNPCHEPFLPRDRLSWLLANYILRAAVAAFYGMFVPDIHREYCCIEVRHAHGCMINHMELALVKHLHDWEPKCPGTQHCPALNE